MRVCWGNWIWTVCHATTTALSVGGGHLLMGRATTKNRKRGVKRCFCCFFCCRDEQQEASIQLQRERRQSRHHRHDHHADGGQKGSCDLRRGEEEIKAEGGEEGETEDTYAWLVDMGGAGPGDAPGLRTLQTLDDILAVHYPGKLGRVLIVNASGDT